MTVSEPTAAELARLTIRSCKALAALRHTVPYPMPDIDAAGYHVLFALDRGAARVTALAELIQSDVSTASRQVSHLDSLALVERVADPEDGRAHLVQLSESGRAVLRALDAHRGQVFGALLATWSEEDASSLVGQLARLVSDIDTYRTALAHQR